MAASTGKCPLCSRSVRVIAERTNGYQTGQQFTLMECEGCLASYASPLAVDDALYGHIYENIRQVPGYNRYYHYATEVLRQRHALDYLSRQEESYWAVATHLKERRKRAASLKVLEVGCGLGYFTYACAKDGCSITGIDISATAVAWATEHYGPYYAKKTLADLKAEGVRYDLVIMNQLIEHLPDVHPFLAEALDILADGGELLVTTPNKSAFPGEQWETELPPVHLWWFSEESIRYLASSHGCAVSFVDFKPYTDRHFRVKELLQAPFRGQPVLDQQGTVIMRQEIAPDGPLKRFLDRTGVLDKLRLARAALQGKDRWRGSQGPILAAVMRRAG